MLLDVLYPIIEVFVFQNDFDEGAVGPFILFVYSLLHLVVVNSESIILIDVELVFRFKTVIVRFDQIHVLPDLKDFLTQIS